MNLIQALRKIRACESEVAAQLVLETLISDHVGAAVRNALAGGPMMADGSPADPELYGVIDAVVQEDPDPIERTFVHMTDAERQDLWDRYLHACAAFRASRF